MDIFNKWEVVDAWKEKFDKTGEDIFDIIENAIRVATRYRPAGLLQKRDEIGGLLFANFYEDDYADILEEKEAEKEINVAFGDNIRATEEEKVVDQLQEKPRHIFRIKLKGDRNFANKKTLVENGKVTNIAEEKKDEQKSKKKVSVALSTPKSILQEGIGMEKTEKIGDEEKEINHTLKFAATKRRFEENHREIESSRKKIRVIDLKDIPSQGLIKRCKKPTIRNVRARFIRC